MTIFDRIKAHQSAPDVYDPPSLESLMQALLEAGKLTDAVLRSDPWEDIDAALAAFRAACGEGE